MAESAREYIPDRPTLPRVREAAAGCRGERIESEFARVAAATIHPAAIVRQRDAEARERERAAFADDLRGVYEQIAQSS